MPFTIEASLNATLPGAVNLVVAGDPVQGWLERVDGALGPQPVRNFAGLDLSGLDTVVDCEAPLGRQVTYRLMDYDRTTVLATSAPITAPPLASGMSLLRSVLKPSVQWTEVEPVTEVGVEWATSTTVHHVVGSDTPVVVGEIRQRHAGTITFFCRTIGDADRVVGILRDGTPMLLRFDPCAQTQVRDILFYALDVTETTNNVPFQRDGGRLVIVDYQTTKFVPGDTLEPPFNEGWDFAALAASANDFAELTTLWPDFLSMATQPMPPTGGP